MLKSTYKPAASAATGPSALPPNWSEHVAPTGHTYYYNSETKQSTYTRPEPLPVPPQPQPQIPHLADPRVANAYVASLRQSEQGGHHARGGGFGGRGGHQARPKPQPVDKPRRKEAIPGHEPWLLVYTKYSRRFVYNPEKGTSYWRIPEKLMPGILELDKARIRQKNAPQEEQAEKKTDADDKSEQPTTAEPASAEAPKDHDYDSSEYEEVEVTDDEGEDGGGGPDAKRQRTEEPANTGPIEFTEEDIAQQLAAMAEDYMMEDDGYDYEGGGDEVDFTEEEAKLLFKDLLTDKGINPYSPWEKLMEDGIIIEDPRYMALSTTKARKECWDEWTRERIAELKAERAKQEKKDPRIAWLAFLGEKASTKLYWPEFKRKWKKEPVMKDVHVPDKEKEKNYREHVNRLKMSQTTLKADLTALLKAQPAHMLNRATTNLPASVLTDIRYISLPASVRDPMVEGYISTLPPPPEDLQAAEEDEEKQKEREKKRAREEKLRERDRMAEKQKQERERTAAAARARARDDERVLEQAMKVDKKGLRGQLADMKVEGETNDVPMSDSKGEDA